MNWILILLLFGSMADGGNAMTSISGFSSHDQCVKAGEAWKKTQRSLDRDYECILGAEK